MNTSMRIKSTAALLGASVLIAAAPAAASVHAPKVDGPEATKADASTGVVIRRDGSKAVPFVAYPTPEKASATASGDGFDWGDGAIGAGAVLLLGTFAALGSAALRDRNSHVARPTGPASQSV